MPIQDIAYKGFIGPSYRSSARIAGDEACINWLIERSEARQQFTFLKRPGLSQLGSTFAYSPCGGLWAGDNRLFAVMGSKLYEVFEALPPHLIGDVGASGGQATMIANGGQLMIVNGGKVYIATGTDLYGTPALPLLDNVGDAVLGSTGTFLDGYFIVAVPNSKTWRWSALNDGLSWDNLDEEQKEGYPDNISRIIAHDRYLWIFGFQTTEIWENSGNPPPASPFSRVSFIPHGCPAPYAVAEVGPTSIMWLSVSQQGGFVVMRADSVQPMRVSTHALEYEISTYDSIEDAEAYSTQFRGHYLFVLTFPSSGVTWVYDLTSSTAAGEPIWTRYAAFSSGTYTRYRGRVHAFIQGWDTGRGMHVLGDYQDGILYQESSEFLTDNGAVLKVERTAPLILEQDQRVTVWRLELLANVGANDSGSEAVVTMEFSKDAGNTYGNEHDAPAGNSGEFSERVLWRQCGTGRRVVFRLTSTSEVPWTWTDAFLRIEVVTV